jgi:diaminopimelate epimerase
VTSRRRGCAPWGLNRLDARRSSSDVGAAATARPPGGSFQVQVRSGSRAGGSEKQMCGNTVRSSSFILYSNNVHLAINTRFIHVMDVDCC